MGRTSREGRSMLPYQTESASSSLPVRRTPPAGHEARRLLAQLEHVRGHVRPAVRPGHGSRLGPADRLDRNQPALGLHDAAEDETRVHRQPDGLLQRGGREVQIEEAVGLPAVPVQVPVPGVVEIETAELEPGPAVVRRGREVAAEEVDRHVPLAFALQGGRARGDVADRWRPGPGRGRSDTATRRAPRTPAQPRHRAGADGRVRGRSA